MLTGSHHRHFRNNLVFRDEVCSSRQFSRCSGDRGPKTPWRTSWLSLVQRCGQAASEHKFSRFVTCVRNRFQRGLEPILHYVGVLEPCEMGVSRTNNPRWRIAKFVLDATLTLLLGLFERYDTSWLQTHGCFKISRLWVNRYG